MFLACFRFKQNQAGTSTITHRGLQNGTLLFLNLFRFPNRLISEFNHLVISIITEALVYLTECSGGIMFDHFGGGLTEANLFWKNFGLTVVIVLSY